MQWLKNLLLPKNRGRNLTALKKGANTVNQGIPWEDVFGDTSEIFREYTKNKKSKMNSKQKGNL